MSSLFSSPSGLNSEASDSTVNTYLRIRPVFGEHRRSDKYKVCNKALWVTKPGKQPTDKTSSAYYTFNEIFEAETTQKDIFEATALPLVKEFVAGKNNLLFSYGITSSGKSYTMRGIHDDPGLIPWSLVALFDQIRDNIDPEVPPSYKISKFCDVQALNETQARAEQVARKVVITGENTNKAEEILAKINDFGEDLGYWKDNTLPSADEEYSLWVSYVEIYNEKVYDLLCPDNDMIIITSGGNFYLKDLTQTFVHSAEEAFAVFLRGQERIHIHSTNLNQHSSRSHSIYTLSLLRTNKKTKETSISKLCFADLAGLERTKKIGLEMIAETKNINKSLSTLGRCISELQNKSSKIPVRDSNLTMVFQPYLTNTGGKMSLIYNLNPSSHLFDESSTSLDFCTTSQRITQQQIAEFRRTVEAKTKHTPREVKTALQRVRNSISALNIDNGEYEALKKELEDALQKVDKLQNENLTIYKQAEEMILRAKDQQKRDKEMHQENLEMMELLYKQKFEIRDADNQNLKTKEYEYLESNVQVTAERDEAVEENKKLTQEIQHLKAEIQDLLEKLAEPSAKKRKTTDNFALLQMTSERNEAQQTVKELEEKLEKLEQDYKDKLEILDADIQNLKTKESESIENNAQLTAERDEASTKADQLDKKVVEMEAKIKGLEKKNIEVTAERDEALKTVKELEEQLESKEKDCLKLQDDHERYRNMSEEKLEIRDAEIQNLKEKLERMEQDYKEKLEKKASEVIENNAQLTAEREEADKKVGEMKAKIAGLEKKNPEVTAERDEALKTAKELAEQLDIKEKHYLKLEADHERLKEDHQRLTKRIKELRHSLKNGDLQRTSQLGPDGLPDVITLDDSHDGPARQLNGDHGRRESIASLPETPEFVAQKPISSTMLLDTSENEDYNSYERYKTPVKPRGNGRKGRDSVVSTYLQSVKKAALMTPLMEQNSQPREVKRIELTKTAKKRLALDTSVADLANEIEDADGTKVSLAKKRYNTRNARSKP